jgi:hypothetical protein
MYRIIAVVSDTSALKAATLDLQIALTERINRQVVEIKDMVKFIGKGIFAKKPFNAGELVVIGIQTEPVPDKTQHSITGPDGNEYIYNHIAETINHHCDPNTGPLKIGESWSFFARRDIKSGEEITWAYDWTEPVIGHFNTEGGNGGKCLCGSAACRTPLKGFNNLNPEQFETIQRQKADLVVAVATHAKSVVS